VGYAVIIVAADWFTAPHPADVIGREYVRRLTLIDGHLARGDGRALYVLARFLREGRLKENWVQLAHRRVPLSRNVHLPELADWLDSRVPRLKWDHERGLFALQATTRLFHNPLRRHIPADHHTAEFEESLVEVGATLVAHAQSAERVQPAPGTLHPPAVPPQAAAVLGVPPGQNRFEARIRSSMGCPRES